MASSINASTSGAGGLISTADSSGVLNIQTAGTTAISVDASQNVTLTNVLPQASGGTGTTIGYNGFKNRIINGAMMIDQRNNGASVTPANGAVTYTVDRFAFFVNQSSKLTAQRSTIAPAGFINSMLITSSSAYSSLSSDVFTMFQAIEGLNISDLGWGAAGASAVTLSFWVRSSLTGTHSGALSNASNTRSYPFSFTISAANTWEQKSITIAGDTTGTWLTTNGAGINVKFNCGCGSSLLGTANTWASSDLIGVTGSVSVVGTSGATFYITGVQLEKGSTATSFDYRPYGTELNLCQRYAYTTSGSPSTSGTAASTTEVQQRFVFPVTMRAAPTTSVTTSGSYQISDDYNADYTASTVSVTETRTSTLMGRIKLSGFTGLTTGRFYGGTTDTATAKITFNSEL